MLHSPVKTVCSCRPLPFSIPGREQSGANPPQSRINPGFFKTFRTLPQQHLFNNVFLINFVSVTSVAIASGIYDPVARKIYV